MRLPVRDDPRVIVRTKPSLDAAVRPANELGLQIAAFFGQNPFVARAHCRHHRVLVDGRADMAAGPRPTLRRTRRNPSASAYLSDGVC
jgi:hypothetical protein